MNNLQFGKRIKKAFLITNIFLPLLLHAQISIDKYDTYLKTNNQVVFVTAKDRNTTNKYHLQAPAAPALKVKTKYIKWPIKNSKNSCTSVPLRPSNTHLNSNNISTGKKQKEKMQWWY